MIWFEQMCCCHLQRQRKRPQAGAERNRTGQAEGLSTACSAVGTPPWLCRGKRAAQRGSKSSYCLFSSHNSTPWLLYGKSWCRHLRGGRQSGISWVGVTAAPTETDCCKARLCPQSMKGRSPGQPVGGRGTATSRTDKKGQTDGMCPPGSRDQAEWRGQVKERGGRTAGAALSFSWPARPGMLTARGVGDRSVLRCREQTRPMPTLIRSTDQVGRH